MIKGQKTNMSRSLVSVSIGINKYAMAVYRLHPESAEKADIPIFPKVTKSEDINHGPFKLTSVDV